MAVSVKRLVHIIACMAFKGVELVADIANEECYIFLGGAKRIPVEWEELDALLEAEIIEFDSGNDEEGYESRAYRLTETAVKKVQVLVDKEMKMRKQNKKLM
jgi:hypothetical protein